MGFDAYSVHSRYGMEPLMDDLRIEQELMTRYLDYAEMQSYPELAAATDIYTDEATQPDVLTGRTIWVESDDGWESTRRKAFDYPTGLRVLGVERLAP